MSILAFVTPLQISFDIPMQLYLFFLLLILVVLLIFHLIKIDKKIAYYLARQKTYQANINNINQSYQQQQLLIEAIPDLILYTDFKGTIVDIVHQGKTNYFDLTKTNISLYSLFPHQIHTKLQKTITSLIKENSTKRTIYFSTKNSQQTTFFECQLKKTTEGEILCTVRDRPELLKKIIDLNQKRYKVQKKINSKDQFLSILAHDLRGPFNSLLGFSGILNYEYEDYSNEEKKQYIKEIYKSSEQLYQLLNNLLNWTRLQNGKIEYSPHKQDLIKTINTAFWEMEQYAREKNISLSKETPKSIIIKHDSTMLHSTIVNLISNAIKYSHPGGEIHLSVTQPVPEYIKVAVHDQGIGIEPEALSGLFQIDSSYKRSGTQNETGSGLGLTLCKEFIEYHKGEIYADSYPEKGSTFEIKIPMS